MTEHVPAMVLKEEDTREIPDDDDAYGGIDEESFEHIDREIGIDTQQRVKAFLRMNLGMVATDIPRRLWNQTPDARKAVDAEWRRLREQDVWDEKTCAA